MLEDSTNTMTDHQDADSVLDEYSRKESENQSNTLNKHQSIASSHHSHLSRAVIPETVDSIADQPDILPPSGPDSVHSMTSERQRQANFYISKKELDNSMTGFSAILPPVFFTMLLSAVTVLYVTPDASETFQDSSLILFSEDQATSGGEAASLGLANALIIIGVITAMTFLIVCLLYFRCEWIFAIYLFLALVMLMGFTTGVMVVEGLRYYLVPTDVFSLAIFFYNYAIVGALAIFSYEVGFQGKHRLIPYSLAQFYLVIISVVMAWLVSSIFPDYTTWALLVCLALYDLCAVLTPCGPLNLLIKVVTNRAETDERRARERGEQHEGGQRQMIPGLLYEVNTGPPRRRKNDAESQGAAAAGILTFAAMMAAPDVEDEQSRNAPTTAAPAPRTSGVGAGQTVETSQQRNPQMYVEEPHMEHEGSNLKLGLGDFVFYSVLTAKSAEFGFTAFICVACCVLCGLCATLVLLSVFQKALPALPISIALGVCTYIVAFKFLSPFSDELSLNMISV